MNGNDATLNQRPFSRPNLLYLSVVNKCATPVTSTSIDQNCSFTDISPKRTNSSKKKFICTVCKKKYQHRKTLNRHVSQVHPSILNVQPAKRTYLYKCDNCPRQFNKLNCLKYHERKKHAAPPATPTLKVCPLCKSSFPRHEIIVHFQTSHGRKIDVEELKFDTFKEFNTWKESIEQSTKSCFRHGRGSLLTNAQKSHFFVCHRSGHYRSKGQGLRKVKMQGSNKIDGFCPAGMKVVESTDGKCLVFFTKTHIGHTNDIDRLFLTPAERAAIAKKITSKVPFDKILDEIKNSVSTGRRERLHLLTRKDLHNIKSCFNSCSDAVCNEDGTSIEDLVAVTETSTASQPSLSDQALREKWKGMWAELINSIKTKEGWQALQTIYMSAKSTLTAVKKGSSTVCYPIAPSETTSVSANKRIAPQILLLSTQKKEKHSDSLSKPTAK